jgi:hypothetical protein
LRPTLRATFMAVVVAATVVGWLVLRAAHAGQPRPDVGPRARDAVTVATSSTPKIPQPVSEAKATDPTKAAAPTVAVLERLEAARRGYADDAREEALAKRTEASLRAGLQDALFEHNPHSPLASDLQVDCRSHYCRLSVPIEAGGAIASLPVIASMTTALQETAPQLAKTGRVAGEGVEPTDPAQARRYAVYVQRKEDH